MKKKKVAAGGGPARRRQKWLPIPEAARLTGIPQRTLRRRADAGCLVVDEPGGRRWKRQILCERGPDCPWRPVSSEEWGKRASLGALLGEMGGLLRRIQSLQAG